MNQTFPILQKLVKNIEPQELSGAKFKTIEAARAVAKQCQKGKTKLIPLEGTPKVLGVEKAFYTMLEDRHVLFIINGEEASIEILPNANDVIYDAYRPVSREWQWWAMGANLCIMLNCLKKLGAKKFQFNEHFIIGIENEETIYCLSADNLGHDGLDKKLPKMPPLKPIPKPKPKKVESEEVPKEEEEPKPEKKSRKKK